MFVFTIVMSFLVAAPALPAAFHSGDPRVEFHGVGGGLVAIGFQDFKGAGAGGIHVGYTWPLSDKARIGLRQTLYLSTVPYGWFDGEEILGRVPEGNRVEWYLTSLPSTSVLLKYEPWSRLSLDLTSGIALAMPYGGGSLESLLPLLSAGAGLEIILHHGESSSWRLRVQSDFYFLWYRDPVCILVFPMAGLVATF